jgi:succinyldiaminopimelate transaminase
LPTPLAHGLPDFPWDRLEPAAALARSHPEGIIDLSIGTPVDPTPVLVQAALAAHADAPGYPTAAGLPELREAWCAWAQRTLGTTVTQDMVAPLLGSKELVAWLPTILGLGHGTTVAIPELAYPTYAVGALMSGAHCVTYRDADDIPSNAQLVWVNSPGNPTGQVLSAAQLQAVVARARSIGALVFSDECYIELGWDEQPVSVLQACDGDVTGVVSVQSLSKRSNLAGYRSGAALGDPAVIAAIIGLRKHAGMLMPTPVQHASIAALSDHEHLRVQKEIYGRRRQVLREAFLGAGFDISHSQAGLYLWVTRGQACMTTVTWLAQRGILAAPGDFYGPEGAQHFRIAYTATDERVAAVPARLS